MTEVSSAVELTFENDDEANRVFEALSRYNFTVFDNALRAFDRVAIWPSGYINVGRPTDLLLKDCQELLAFTQIFVEPKSEVYAELYELISSIQATHTSST